MRFPGRCIWLGWGELMGPVRPVRTDMITDWSPFPLREAILRQHSPVAAAGRSLTTGSVGGI